MSESVTLLRISIKQVADTQAMDMDVEAPLFTQTLDFATVSKFLTALELIKKRALDELAMRHKI